MSANYSIGLLNQLADALENAGFSPEDVNRLRQYGLKEIKDVLYNKAEITYPEHLIDTDADPFLPEGWQAVEEHQKSGMLKWDSSKFSLYLSKKQKKDYIVGNDLREELKNKNVLNANVLDYLLAHQELIPDEWKGKAVFFWGTIYRYSGGDLVVRCLSWDGSQWHWCLWLGSYFRSSNPAVVASRI
ncbi:MAG: hypothetical protein V1765_00325 [bacterium]